MFSRRRRRGARGERSGVVMTKATLNTKLLKCFFAFALVLGLCVPSIGSAAYGEPDQDVTFTRERL